MCGITGFIDLEARTSAETLARSVVAMRDAMSHRGPDEGQHWTDADAGVALGFRRLAIIDVSPAGRQPMVSADGRWVICYNGEIYNAEDLRAELGAHAPNWRGHSDTEVLLACISAWGLERALDKAAGMFAIALWDRLQRQLHLVRDRFGKKPLYWTRANGHVLFGSELRTLRAHPSFRPEIDQDAVAGYMRTGYVRHPRSIYRGVSQVPPGHHIVITPGRDAIDERAYWSLEATIREAHAAPFQGSDQDAVDGLEKILGDAVRRRMVADVPLGAFLSGGYDSSTVVALMQTQSSRPVRTFSIGFEEAAYDESQHARAVAQHLGTDHTELIATPDDALAVIPRLADIYDEPFADSSQIPTFLVSELARRHVTVALSGDGGDEVFAGYNRYRAGALFGRWVETMPRALRGAGASAIQAVAPATWDRVASLVPGGGGLRSPGDKLHKIASIAAGDGDDFYRRLTSTWSADSRPVPNGTEDALPSVGDLAWAGGPVAAMQMLDTLTYLPGDILTKVDRASMAVSLEARCPILDHRVVAYGWSLPERLKLRGAETKWVLRQVAYRHLPKALLERPKTGFGIPIDRWLRGALKDWAEDLLDPRRLGEAGLVDVPAVRTVWAEHLSGRRNWSHAIWNALMLEAWRRRYHG